MPAIIERIVKNSIGSELGLKKGDQIISVNGEILRDILDFQFFTNDEEITLTVKTKNGIEEFEIEKDFDENLGIEFNEAIFDNLKTCGANCIFCFERQLPKNMRKSLTLKDDDYRLSFLYGCYITLGNLANEDIKRIISQRLSPLYVSIHAVNNELREKIIGKKTRPILSDIKYLCEKGIKIHTQVVLCEKINDGKYLEETIDELSKLYPCIASLAIVPVGLTSHRKNLPEIKHCTKNFAIKTLNLIEKKAEGFYQKYGTHFVWASDEFYIKAEKDIPEKDYYEDYLQIENGIGLIRDFMEDAKKVIKKINKLDLKKKVKFSMITGKSFYPYLKEYLNNIKNNNLLINLFEIPNNLFGETITVTGLLCGKDIENYLKDKELGDFLLIPNVCISDNGEFLDDMKTLELEEKLKTKIIITKPFISNVVKILKNI